MKQKETLGVVYEVPGSSVDTLSKINQARTKLLRKGLDDGTRSAIFIEKSSPHIEWFILIDPILSHGAKILWLLLFKHTIKNSKSAAPKIQELAKYMGISERQVFLYLSQLEDSKVLIRQGKNKTIYSLFAPIRDEEKRHESLSQDEVLRKDDDEIVTTENQ